MHRLIAPLLLACSLLLATAALAADPAAPDVQDMRLLRMPDIHDGTVVFVYGGDLWTVSAEGGEARRLTSSVGFESYPKFSPDGQWIAFSGEYDGNHDVYVMPAAGGPPTRLTFHPSWDRVIDWQPDGEHIRFQSARHSHTGRDLQLYTVSRDGGLPEQMILPTGGLSSYSPDGERIAYNRISRENRTWKRYKGGMAQDVWIYDFADNASQRLTDWVGTDNFPMWHEGAIYFTSDREKDKLNLWKIDPATGDATQVTFHDEYDVKYPSLGPDAIVYENGGWLYVLDLATAGAEPRKLDVTLRSDQVWARPRYESVDDQIRTASIGPDGNRVLVGARGEIFSVPAEKGPVRNLTGTESIREREPVWSPTGDRLAFVSDRSGEYEIYVRQAGELKDEAKQLTDGLKIWVNSMKWSPEGDALLVSTADLELLIVDTGSGDMTRVDRSPTDDIRDFAWSPGGDWVAYAMAETNNFSSIFLYDVDAGKVHRVTTNFTNDGAPCFDDEGKYLFFASARHFNPTLGGFDLKPLWTEMDGLYVVTLREDLDHPFPPESDEVAVKSDDEDEPKDKDKDQDEEKDEKKKEEKEPLRIDLEDLVQRTVALDVPAGNYSDLSFADGKLFYMSRPFRAGGGRGNGGPNGSLMVFDMKEREAKSVLDGIFGYDLSADGQKVLYYQPGKLGIVEAKADQKPAEKPLRTGEMKTWVDPRAEWTEMMRDAWRLERDFFYDPDLYGIDWDHMYDRYSQLVPYIGHPMDFSYVVGEMISELSAGHAYVRPGDQPDVDKVGVGLLGCDFQLDEASGRYRISRILDEHDWNEETRTPLHGPGIDVSEGDYLLAVNGVELRAPRNPYSLLVDTAGEQVVLTVGPRADGKDSRDVTVQPIASERDLRYEAWVRANRRLVEKLSDGRIGYLHLPNTAVGGQQGFAKGYYPQLRKEALIIDERFNGGGFIPDFFMNIMKQKLVNLWKPRYGQDWRTPGTAFIGHLAMLSNGYAGSGGDALPYYFKAYDLGPVIGTRTWGGLVGISRGIPLMDGGSVTFPEFGFYNLQGELDVENHGVDPTIEVDNIPSEVIAGRDPQIEKGVEVLLQKLKEEPVEVPEFQGFPRGR